MNEVMLKRDGLPEPSSLFGLNPRPANRSFDFLKISIICITVSKFK